MYRQRLCKQAPRAGHGLKEKNNTVVHQFKTGDRLKVNQAVEERLESLHYEDPYNSDNKSPFYCYNVIIPEGIGTLICNLILSILFTVNKKQTFLEST